MQNNKVGSTSINPKQINFNIYSCSMRNYLLWDKLCSTQYHGAHMEFSLNKHSCKEEPINSKLTHAHLFIS